MHPATPSWFYGTTLACRSGQRIYSTMCGRWWSVVPASTYVVDDFGNLAQQSAEQSAQGVHFINGCPSIDEAGDVFLLAQDRVRDLEIELRAAQRALLQALPAGAAQ